MDDAGFFDIFPLRMVNPSEMSRLCIALKTSPSSCKDSMVSSLKWHGCLDLLSSFLDGSCDWLPGEVLSNDSNDE